MKRFKKLLVATDTRLNEHPVVDEAAEIALANAASLTIVDVVPASSWIAEFVTNDLASMRELYAQETERETGSSRDYAARKRAGRYDASSNRKNIRRGHS